VFEADDDPDQQSSKSHYKKVEQFGWQCPCTCSPGSSSSPGASLTVCGRNRVSAIAEMPRLEQPEFTKVCINISSSSSNTRFV
jgi:hypothetical protein